MLQARYPHTTLLAACAWDAALERSVWDMALGARLTPSQLYSLVPLALDLYQVRRMPGYRLGLGRRGMGACRA